MKEKKFSELSIVNADPTFKSWTKPGPFPALDIADQLVLEDGETLDALCGHFRITQLKNGHRFSTDDLLVGWYASAFAPSPGSVLDLGSGLGTVAMTTAWRLRGVPFTTIEAQPESIALARKSIRYNGLDDRFTVLEGDFRTFDFDGQTFDLVTGSPPYFPLTDGPQPDHPQKVQCRFEVRGDLGAYIETARRVLEPGGWFVMVFPIDPPHQKDRVFEAAREHDMRIVRWRPVSLQEGRAHDIGLFAMARREDVPAGLSTFEEPKLVIRNAEGRISEEYLALKMSFGFPPTE